MLSCCRGSTAGGDPFNQLRTRYLLNGDVLKPGAKLATSLEAGLVDCSCVTWFYCEAPWQRCGKLKWETLCWQPLSLGQQDRA